MDNSQDAKPQIAGSRRRRRGRRSHKRLGAAAVEFAVVAPILLLVVMSTVEFGRGLLVKQVLTNASRAGARVASLPNSTASQVEAAVSDYAASGGIDNVVTVINPSPTAASAGDAVSVSATVSFDDVSWLPSAWFLGGVDLNGTSVMRKEGFE